MADLSEYKELDGIEFRPEVKKLMQIFADTWDECRADHCSECKYRHGNQMYRMLICMSERYAENLLSADVAPVVHGRWIERKSIYADGGIIATCSACQKDVQYLGNPLNYCPNCGARMDGDG